ncbi:MAG: VWA domain-containing protein [Candidatus Acidiferrales bacterium]
MPLRRALLLVVLLTPAASLALSAQEPPCARRTVVVNVVDKNGEQVWGLTAADFRGEFRGQPVKILSVAVDPPPHRVVILLDASGSMGRSAKWELAQTLADDILQPSPFYFPAALVIFSDKIRKEVGFEQGHGAVAQAVAELTDKRTETKVEGRTALLDAIMRALGLLAPARVGDAVYLLTDGGDNASHAKSRDVEDALLASGTRLFALLLPDPTVRPEPEMYFGPESLRRFAEACGGSLNVVGTKHFNLSEKELAALAEEARRKFYSPMATFYLVKIELPQNPDKPRSWKLEVVDPAGRKRKDLTVLYPQKLLPCPATAAPAPK